MYRTSGLSLALEDYLEVMLDLGEKEKEIRVTDIAKSLHITKATVSQTLHKLKKIGMVDQESYGPVFLTSVGREEALKIRRRHRIIKQFLIEVLEVDMKTAEKDACLMEHVLSNATMKKLADFIIKNHKIKEREREGNMEKINVMALSQLQKKQKGKIIRISAQGEMKERFLEMGLVNGTEIILTGSSPLGDPLEITVKGYKLTLRKQEAKNIFVEMAKE